MHSLITSTFQLFTVPTSNKRDLRSIEQILHDNKVKKKKKREEEEGGDGGGGGTNSKT